LIVKSFDELKRFPMLVPPSAIFTSAPSASRIISAGASILKSPELLAIVPTEVLSFANVIISPSEDSLFTVKAD